MHRHITAVDILVSKAWFPYDRNDRKSGFHMIATNATIAMIACLIICLIADSVIFFGRLPLYLWKKNFYIVGINNTQYVCAK